MKRSYYLIILVIFFVGCTATKLGNMKLAYNTGVQYSADSMDRAIPQFLLAIKEAKETLEKNPSCIECYSVLGSSYLKLGNYDLATKYLRLGIDRAINEEANELICGLYLSAANAMYSKFEFKHAYDLFSSAISAPSNDSGCKFTSELGMYITALSDNTLMSVDDVIAGLNNMYSKYPASSVVLSYLSRAYLATGELDLAWDIMIKAKSIKLPSKKDDNVANYYLKVIHERKLALVEEDDHESKARLISKYLDMLNKLGIIDGPLSVDFITMNFKTLENIENVVICKYIGVEKIGNILPPNNRWFTIEDIDYPIRIYAIGAIDGVNPNDEIVLSGRVKIINNDIIFAVNELIR